MKKIELMKATMSDYPIIQNMARFYAYDMSRECGQSFEGWEFPDNGLYECIDFKKYLQGNNPAFLIKVDGELAGFAFVNQLEIMPEVDWNMGEFFIVAKFQRSGIGKRVANRLFDQFPGEWAVGAIVQNMRARHFWKKVIAQYTYGNFTEVEKTSDALKTAEHPDPFPMVIFRFKTPSTKASRNKPINTDSFVLREPTLEDEQSFLTMTQQSQALHHPWVKAPLTSSEYKDYVQRSLQPNQKSYLCFYENNLVGVFNLSEIVQGCFQSAYLGFYASLEQTGKGLMSEGLKLLLKKAFTELSLHRVEANIQPNNIPSILLVQRNGFKKEGFSPNYLKIDNVWRDHERWALTVGSDP